MLVKKFPTDKAIHYNSLSNLFQEKGLDERVHNHDNNKDFWYYYIHSKLYKNTVFPKFKIIDLFGNGDKLIEKEAVFLLPRRYDHSDDLNKYKEMKEQFHKEMKLLMGNKYDEKTLNENVNFGPKDFSWVNDFLDVVYERYSQFYQDGYLRVWMPADVDYNPWKGYDYPHKYNTVGDLVRPNGVYYLSDVEKYIDDKYGIQDDQFYYFIISNQYIEGRYWERIWNIGYDYAKSKLDTSKLSRGSFGLKATENINHMLNIIEKDFKEDLVTNSDYESGLILYIDYYKKVKALL